MCEISSNIQPPNDAQIANGPAFQRSQLLPVNPAPACEAQQQQIDNLERQGQNQQHASADFANNYATYVPRKKIIPDPDINQDLWAEEQSSQLPVGQTEFSQYVAKNANTTTWHFGESNNEEKDNSRNDTQMHYGDSANEEQNYSGNATGGQQSNTYPPC